MKAVGWLCAVFSCACGMFYGENCFAFGLKTHGWIATEVLSEIQSACRVVIAGASYELAKEQCVAIRAHPGDFLSGAMGPDIYPDVIAGQVTTHPGLANGWQTGDWLKHVVFSANDDRSLAFAMGYLLHAAGDTFAHSYVNTFAGDIFELADERAVETRHVAIEKYLDAHVPALAANPDALEIPVDFLRDTLLYNKLAVTQYKISGVAPHLVSMYEVRSAVEDFTKGLEAIEDVSSNLLAKYIAAHVVEATKLATGETQLEAARETLRLVEQEAALRRKAYDEAKDAFDKAAREVERNDLVEKKAALERETQDAAINAAEDAVKQATETLSDLNTRHGNLQRDLRNTPATVSREVCKFVTKNLPPPLDDVVDEVCNTVNVVNDTYTRLNNQIADINGKIGEETRKKANATAALTAATARKAAALQQWQQAESNRIALDSVKRATEAAYSSAIEPLKVQERMASDARSSVSKLEDEVKGMRRRLADYDKLESAIKSVLDDLNYLSVLGRNWEDGIERAGAEYMNVGLRASQHILKSEGGTLNEYATWLSCHGHVFLAVPYQIAEGGCAVKNTYEEVMNAIEKIQRQLLPPGLREIYDKVQELRATAIADVKREVTEATIELVEFLSNDHSLAELIRLLEDPSLATRGKVQELLGKVGNSDGKQLLIFPNGADLIDADAHMSGTWDSEQFNAVTYARVMSRLALLSGEELNEMAGRVSGRWFRRWKLHPEGVSRYSVLFQTLRSIDGNHQWQPYGLPYARSVGPPVPAPGQRHYGYGPRDGQDFGFALFINEDARTKVFLRLFPKQLSVVENDPRLQTDYPFPSCEKHPFPITFNEASGEPTQSDEACRK